jgi:hypothetical protein
VKPWKATAAQTPLKLAQLSASKYPDTMLDPQTRTHAAMHVALVTIQVLMLGQWPLWDPPRLKPSLP